MRKHQSPPKPRPFNAKQRSWTFFSNGCIRGVHRSEMVVVKSRPRQSLAVDTVAVFTISRAAAIIATLFLATILALLATACVSPRALTGGQASSSIIRPGRSHLANLTQPENPKEPSRQTVQSEQTVDFVLPAGTAVSLGDSPSDAVEALCPATNAVLAAGSAALAASSAVDESTETEGSHHSLVGKDIPATLCLQLEPARPKGTRFGPIPRHSVLDFHARYMKMFSLKMGKFALNICSSRVWRPNFVLPF